jgi:nitroreductase
MEVLTAIKERRSVRRYQDKAVPEETLLQLVEAARWAPSASNGQPWQFIITTDREKRQRYADNVRWASFLPQAAAAIIVCARFTPRTRPAPVSPALEYYCVQDTAAAIQNILLAAHAQGLGTCWIGDLKEDLLQEMFAIPAEWVPVAIISVGYPAESPEPRPRHSLEEITHWERF